MMLVLYFLTLISRPLKTEQTMWWTSLWVGFEAIRRFPAFQTYCLVSVHPIVDQPLHSSYCRPGAVSWRVAANAPEGYGRVPTAIHAVWLFQ